MTMKSKNYTLPKDNPIILAPLAGVSDFAFRLMCQKGGADLTLWKCLVLLIHETKNT